MIRQSGSRGPVAAVLTMLILACGPAWAQHPSSHASPHASPPHGGGATPGAGAHQHLDGRFAHNQYYYNRGYTVHQPPSGAGSLGEFRGRDGGRYWLHGGQWYRWNHGGWVIWGAPIGLFIPFLPFYFTTVWWDGIPYYYADDTYYQWNAAQHEYEVVTPPDGIESDGSTEGPSGTGPIIYPKNGQSAQQQDKDRSECHQWAVGQSHFDPSASAAAAHGATDAGKRNDYYRALAACLEGRGYTVK